MQLFRNVCRSIHSLHTPKQDGTCSYSNLTWRFGEITGLGLTACMLCANKPTPKPQCSDSDSPCLLLGLSRGSSWFFSCFRDSISPPHCPILGFWRDESALEDPPGFLYSESCHLLGCPNPLLAFTSSLPEYLGILETKESGSEIRQKSFLDS